MDPTQGLTDRASEPTSPLPCVSRAGYYSGDQGPQKGHSLACKSRASGEVEGHHHVDDPAGRHEDPEEQAEEHK